MRELKTLKAGPGPVAVRKELEDKGRGSVEKARGVLHNTRTCELSKDMQTTEPEKFDAFSFTNPLSGRGQGSLVLYDGYDLGLDGTIVDAVDVSSSADIGGPGTRTQTLPDFEDLLDLS